MGSQPKLYPSLTSMCPGRQQLQEGTCISLPLSNNVLGGSGESLHWALWATAWSVAEIGASALLLASIKVGNSPTKHRIKAWLTVLHTNTLLPGRFLQAGLCSKFSVGQEQITALTVHNMTARSRGGLGCSRKHRCLQGLCSSTTAVTPHTSNPTTAPSWNRSPRSQNLFLYNCLYKFNKGKTASGRSTKTTPYNNGTYECRILQSGNNHVINLKWELNSHFKERETTFDHLFYCWTHCIN